MVPAVFTTVRSTPPIPLIFAVTATGIMANSIIAPLLPDIVDDFGLSDAATGLVVAAVALPGIVMAPVIGLIADRLGRRGVLVACLAIFGFAALVVSTAPSYPILLLGRFLQGFGAAGLINLSVVIIGDHWDGAERTKLIGRNASVLTIGLAIFPLVSGIIAEFSSWRYALAPQLAALVVAALAWRILPNGHRSTPGSVTEQLRGLGVALRLPVLRTVMLAGFVVFVLIFGIFLATLPLHLERRFDLGAGARGAMLSVPAISASLVAFNLGRITIWFRRPLVLTSATALFVVSFALMGLATTLVLVAIACLLYGLGDGALIPILQDAAVTAAPTEQRAAVVAVWVGFSRLGQTVGPLVAAVIFGLASTTAALYAGAILAAALLVVIGLSPLVRTAR
jgi:ACDE family multidrug resistance protein